MIDVPCVETLDTSVRGAARVGLLAGIRGGGAGGNGLLRVRVCVKKGSDKPIVKWLLLQR